MVINKVKVLGKGILMYMSGVFVFWGILKLVLLNKKGKIYSDNFMLIFWVNMLILFDWIKWCRGLFFLLSIILEFKVMRFIECG